jgi:hypothetical protein
MIGPETREMRERYDVDMLGYVRYRRTARVSSLSARQQVYTGIATTRSDPTKELKNVPSFLTGRVAE